MLRKNKQKIIFQVVGALLLVMACGCCSGPKSNSTSHPGNGNGDSGPVSLTKWDLWSGDTQLRGANIYQRRVYPELDGTEFMGSGPVGPVYTQEDLNRLAALGANYVNVSHPGIFTEDPAYQMSDAILNHLHKVIDMIGAADMFAVISFRTGPGRSEFTFFWGDDDQWFDESYYNDRIWMDPAAQAAWIEMWRETARQFSGNPYVIGYDLMVEPNANEVILGIWEPEDFYPRYQNSTCDWNRLFPSIITAIREIDEATPILVGGMGYSAVAWLPFIRVVQDTRTVYMFHQYEPFVYTHQASDQRIVYPGNMDLWGEGTFEYVDADWLANLLTTVDRFVADHGAKVGCNEFGLVRWAGNSPEFLGDLLDLLEARHINHALWVWDPSYRAYTDEVNAFNFRFGTQSGNMADDPDNPLIEVIRACWSKNRYKPSTVSFDPP